MATESFFKTFRPTEEGCIMVLQDLMNDEPSKIQQEILAMPKRVLRVGKDISFEEFDALRGSALHDGE